MRATLSNASAGKEGDMFHDKGNGTSSSQQQPSGRHGPFPNWGIRGGPFVFTRLHPSMKIKSATITPMPRPMPLGMFDPMPEVIATFEDGSTKSLFSFYPDEVSFTTSEFVGLTEEEAHTLFQQKDTAYLRS
jgi:hypothetical protein